MTPFEFKLLESAIAFAFYIIVRLTMRYFVYRALKKFNFSKQRRTAISKVLNIVLFAILVLAMLGIWGLKGSQILVYLTSILAVIGVALFAQWSILSNITAGIVLYFNHPLKLGDFIKILDKDLPMEGYVEDITLYFLHIKTLEGKRYTLPNSLVLQKILTIEYEAPKKPPHAETADSAGDEETYITS